METVYRGVICKAEIIKGKDVLKTAQKYGRNLYNFTWWCAVGYNWRVRKWRGQNQSIDVTGKREKWPGYIGIQKAMMDTPEYIFLSDRVASYILRGFDSSMRSWFSNLKSNPNARPPRYSKVPPPLTFEVGRNAKLLGDNIWRFTALRNDVDDRYIFVHLYLPPLTCPERVESVKFLHDGRCAVSYKANIKPNGSGGVAGVDLGINRIATVAFENGESIMYAGGLLLSTQRYFQKRIAACKPSGYNENKTSKKKSERSQSYYQDWAKQKRLMLDNLTASIVDECRGRGVGSIVVGDLKGIRESKDFGKEMNQKLHVWPFAEILKMLEYKAERFGIQVETISERYTSRTCVFCEYINPASARVERGLLVCRECGAHIHADVNGSFNILKKYLPPERQAGVVACLRGQPSTGIRQGTGELLPQIIPTFSAKFDLRNYAVVLNRCR